jgi:hypothetical protein
MVVKVAGMCWVTNIGRLVTCPIIWKTLNSACGPPVEDPTAMQSGRNRLGASRSLTGAAG